MVWIGITKDFENCDYYGTIELIYWSVFAVGKIKYLTHQYQDSLMVMDEFVNAVMNVKRMGMRTRKMFIPKYLKVTI